MLTVTQKPIVKVTQRSARTHLRKLSFKRWQDDTLAARCTDASWTDSGTESHAIPGWSIHEELEANSG